MKKTNRLHAFMDAIIEIFKDGSVRFDVHDGKLRIIAKLPNKPLPNKKSRGNLALASKRALR